MVPIIYAIATALTIGQPAPGDSAQWQLQPHLGRGQELVYRGTFTEEAAGSGVHFQRSYRLENRVFVLNATAQGADVAILTLWKGRPSKPETTADLETSSVRLECSSIDNNGRIRDRTKKAWPLPLDGPPTLECGVFVEVPFQRVGSDQFWEVADEGRPPLSWHVAGMDAVSGVRCVKLVGVQQSDDWDKPRGDHTAWRRQETAWLVPQAGYAYKVERIIEQREPSRRDPGQRLVVKYELESSMQYPGQLYEDRRREITQIQALRDAVAALLPRAGEVGPRPFEVLQARIKNHVDSQAPTPYREAMRNVLRLAEAGRRGDVPPEVAPTETAPVAQVIALGKPAPDFLTTDLATRQSARLRSQLGQPILLVFYNPASPLGTEVLRFAQQVSEANTATIHVIGMAVSEDIDRVLKQRDDLKLSFSIWSGTGLRISYALETTPKLVVIDAAGVVRGSYLGWGPETPTSITGDLQGCKVTPK